VSEEETVRVIYENSADEVSATLETIVARYPLRITARRKRLRKVIVLWTRVAHNLGVLDQAS
jgi:hypothetical protein